ncbi:MAG TPA: hypothetical protein VGP43_01885 [Chitinophagaceae bacterium]|nr:hypothetical protein [Chitinophagaceae bacterium]
MLAKKILTVAFIFISSFARAQKIDSIFVNLYTDSLKKGTYNYINVDGQLSNGRYMPLDSSQIIFWASDGKFSGNSLWLDKDFKHEKVFIKVVLRRNPSISKEFTVYIKKRQDDEKLQTNEELLNNMQNKSKIKKPSKSPEKKTYRLFWLL